MTQYVPRTLIDRTIRERIILVGVALPGADPDEVEAGLDELALLVDTAGAEVVDRMVQRRERPDPATFVGRGKAEELAVRSEQVDADTVVFDEELSPAQQRNLERLLGRTAIDRTAVILDIFAQNARSPEGKAQVELALLRYRLPRLRGRGQSLSQQAGGIGSRGPGETQLEVDRRRLVRRMHRLEADLRGVERTREVQRRSRRRGRHRLAALVGYTNAGKSTLLNGLTDAGVPAEDRLFSTLDPRTRQLALPGGETVLLTDTVGFVRKLPHELVEAFRSTLDSLRLADLLVHVVDGSAADPEGQIDAVRTVLAEIGADRVPELLVVNKADRLGGLGRPPGLEHTAGVGQGPHAPEEGGLGRPPGPNNTAGVGQGPHAPEEGGLGRPPGLEHTAGVGQGPHAPEEGGLGRPPGLEHTAGVGQGPHAPEEGGLGRPPGPNNTAAGAVVARHPGAVEVSARTGAGLAELVRVLTDRLHLADRVVELRVPWSRGDVLAAVHREGEVVGRKDLDDEARVQVVLDDVGLARFREFLAV